MCRRALNESGAMAGWAVGLNHNPPRRSLSIEYSVGVLQGGNTFVKGATNLSIHIFLVVCAAEKPSHPTTANLFVWNKTEEHSSFRFCSGCHEARNCDEVLNWDELHVLGTATIDSLLSINHLSVCIKRWLSPVFFENWHNVIVCVQEHCLFVGLFPRPLRNENRLRIVRFRTIQHHSFQPYSFGDLLEVLDTGNIGTGEMTSEGDRWERENALERINGPTISQARLCARGVSALPTTRPPASQSTILPGPLCEAVLTTVGQVVLRSCMVARVDSGLDTVFNSRTRLRLMSSRWLTGPKSSWSAATNAAGFTPAMLSC
eukprot:m.40320 g.40320  ORF g.40320 m.40320 type:complete len:318 (+) comp8062_c0_seq1:731-1684(+)